jgi:hypothetical protein
VVIRTRATGCHGAHRQNDSVPVAVIRSTSWSGACSREQLPSGSRARTARAVTVAVNRPFAAVNFPVPPAIFPVWRIVIVATQLRGLTEGCGSPPLIVRRLVCGVDARHASGDARQAVISTDPTATTWRRYGEAVEIA